MCQRQLDNIRHGGDYPRRVHIKDPLAAIAGGEQASQFPESYITETSLHPS